MAQVDDFLRQHVSGGLEPGESILGLGLLRRPTKFNMLLVPERYDDHLGVATDRRLIVFDTEVGGMMTPTAKPIARNPIEWRYDELAEVTTKPVEGLVVHSGGAATAIGLIPHPGCGPLHAEEEPGATAGKGRRYDVYAQIPGLDGQRAFHAQFPGWLQQQVAARAFPMSPERRGAIEARIAQRRAALAEEQARRLRAAAERDAELKALWERASPFAVPAMAVALVLGLGGWGGVALAEGVSDIGEEETEVEYFEAKTAMLDRDLATWVRRADLDPPPDCPEKTWPERRYDTDRADTCHLCVPGDEFAWNKKVVREGRPWSCPPTAQYESNLRSARNSLETARDLASSSRSDIVFGAFLLVLAVALAPVGFVLTRWLSRRRAAAAGAVPGVAASNAVVGTHPASPPGAGSHPGAAPPGPPGSHHPGGAWPPHGSHGGGWPPAA